MFFVLFLKPLGFSFFVFEGGGRDLFKDVYVYLEPLNDPYFIGKGLVLEDGNPRIDNKQQVGYMDNYIYICLQVYLYIYIYVL